MRIQSPVTHTHPDRSAGKITRHRTILAVIAARPIRTQDELVAELQRKRLQVTQATVSRDIRELRLIRIHDRDGGRYVAAPASPEQPSDYASHLESIFHDHVRGVEFVDNLAVIRTYPSSAPLVASALDSGHSPEIAGTVAGDDTVIVVVRGTAAARRLHSRFAKLTGNRP